MLSIYLKGRQNFQKCDSTDIILHKIWKAKPDGAFVSLIFLWREILKKGVIRNKKE